MAQENQALDTNEQVEIRKEKLETLKAAGKDPFVTTKFDVTHHSVDIKNDFDNLENKQVTIAGRMMFKRIMGKASFCNLSDRYGSMQCYVARDSIGEEAYADFKK